MLLELLKQPQMALEKPNATQIHVVNINGSFINHLLIFIVYLANYTQDLHYS